MPEYRMKTLNIHSQKEVKFSDNSRKRAYTFLVFSRTNPASIIRKAEASNSE
jgi:hypothetical protein